MGSLIKKLTNFGLVLCVLLIAFLLGALKGNDVFQSFYEVRSNIAGCEGIDNFYTNNTFYYDVFYMKRQYKNCYNTNESLSNGLVLLYKPMDLIVCQNKSIDCEDYSHMVKCLAEKYQIECELYITSRSHSAGHAGVKCLIDGEWEDIN